MKETIIVVAQIAKKKVVEDTYGFMCPNETCGKKTDTPTFYYSFSVKFQDFTGSYYGDVFGINAEKIIKIPAESYRNLIESKDQAKLDSIQLEVDYTDYYFICKPKIQSYNNKERRRLNVFRVEVIEKNSEVKKLSNEIFGLLCKN